MITTNKCILTTKDQRLLKELSKFEGIKLVTVTEQRDIENVWSFNKTPVVIDGKCNGGIPIPSFEVGRDFERDFTTWAYQNGIDPGEMSSGKKFDTRKDSCILCAIGKYKGGTIDGSTYNSSVENEVDCIVYESTNFFITSELGALKLGFLMIVPKAHILSVAQFPTLLRQEYQECVEDVERILVATFGNGPVSFFEHGSGPSGFTSHPKSIVHAHVHVLHGFAMRKSDLDRVQCRPVKSLEKTVAASTHYFSYQCGEKGQLYCCSDDRVYVPRQYARQIIARDLGYPPGLYNWRKSQFRENVHQTLYAVWRTLKYTDLGARIKARTKEFIEGYGRREDFEH